MVVCLLYTAELDRNQLALNTAARIAVVVDLVFQDREVLEGVRNDGCCIKVAMTASSDELNDSPREPPSQGRRRSRTMTPEIGL
jgi:hypothetical protein